jgi:two-component system sensor histidine kinase MprB
VSLRRRLVLLAAGTVAASIVLASIGAYLAMRAGLRAQVDDTLRDQAAAIADRRGPDGGPRLRLRERRLPGPPGWDGPLEPPAPRLGEAAGIGQIVTSDGAVRVRPAENVTLPVDEVDREVAAGKRGEVLRDVEVDGEHLRVLTRRLEGRPLALQLARSLEGVDSTLARLRIILLGVLAAGTAFALAISRLFARKVVAPVTELTEAAEHVGATDDLDRRIEAGGDDEVGRMAQRFNEMLDRLQASREELAASAAAQRQLVADASHELRTPVTSLRTNIEVLLEGGAEDPEERRRVLEDVRAQAAELGALINDVIELARGDQPVPEDAEDVRLDEVVAEEVERVRRHAPDVRFVVDAEPQVVAGAGDRLGRAVANLLVNAAGHSPPGAPVEVRLRDGVLEVRDHGPGVPDEDKPFVFDRFYRGASARSRPGSGLGLAIVRQAIEAHGGTVEVADAPGGGALFRVRLPTTAPGRRGSAAEPLPAR